MQREDERASVRNIPSAVFDFIEHNRGRKVLLEHEVKGLLKEMGLPVPRGTFIRKGGSEIYPDNLRYPLVTKVSSERITSKTDVHGVRTGIADESEMRAAVEELMRIDGAEGVLVEEMAPEGTEVIVGGITDVQFGPVIMFGLGGIFVELFKDVSFGLAPLIEEDALRLVKQVKGYKLLEGYRGRPPLDVKSLLNIIVIVSELTATGLVGEIDLNPVVLYPEGAMVLDAKLSISGADSGFTRNSL